MTRIFLFFVLALSTGLSAPACKKASKDHASGEGKATSADSTSAGASRPMSKPGAVVATIQLPTGVNVEGLAKAVDNIQPGTSAMMMGSLPVGLGELAGMDLAAADLNAPISLIVASPKTYEKPLALLVKPSDKSALEASAKAAGVTLVSKNGLALLGPAGVVEAVQEAAFANLAKAPPELVARVYPTALIKMYKGDLHAAIEKMGDMMSQQQGGVGGGFKALMVAYEEMIVAIGEQTEFVEMRIGATDDASDLFFRMQPRAGTTMAALATAQVASQHELLGKLPADTAGSVLFSGDLRAGAARQPMIDFSMKMMTAIMPTEASSEMAAMLATWFNAFDGRIAMSMSMDMSNPMAPKFQATYVMGSSDADGMRKGWRELMKAMVARAKEGTVDMMGMKFDIGFTEKALEVDGVEVDSYRSKLNLEQLSPEQREAMAAASMDQSMHFATFDDVAVMAMAEDSARAMTAAVFAARGKAPGYQASGSLGKALERSKGLKESMVFAMEMSKLIPAGVPVPFGLVTMGMGQDAGALTMRVSVRK